MKFEKQFAFVWTWAYRILKVSALWLLLNFVYILLFLNLVTATNTNEVGTLLLTAVALISVVFAPGTIASAKLARDLYLENEISLSKIIKSYKSNYKLGFSQGLIFQLILFILYTMYWYYGHYIEFSVNFLVGVLLVCFVLFIFVLFYSADRKEKLLIYWKNSILLLLRHPIFTIYMITFVFFIGYIVRINGALVLFVAPGAILFVVGYFYLETISKEAKELQKAS